jgi:hypothetical protein
MKTTVLSGSCGFTIYLLHAAPFLHHFYLFHMNEYSFVKGPKCSSIFLRTGINLFKKILSLQVMKPMASQLKESVFNSKS